MRIRRSIADARSSGGFTLVELVTTVILCGIIAGTVSFPFVQALKTRNRFTTRSTLLFEGRTALDLMARELREITNTAGDAGISLADDDQISFGTFSYRLSGGALERSQDSGTTWKTLASGVSTLTFTYGDETGTALANVPLNAGDRVDIRRITIALATASGTETLSLRTGVYLRLFAYP